MGPGSHDGCRPSVAIIAFQGVALQHRSSPTYSDCLSGQLNDCALDLDMGGAGPLSGLNGGVQSLFRNCPVVSRPCSFKGFPTAGFEAGTYPGYCPGATGIGERGPRRPDCLSSRASQGNWLAPLASRQISLGGLTSTPIPSAALRTGSSSPPSRVSRQVPSPWTGEG